MEKKNHLLYFFLVNITEYTYICTHILIIIMADNFLERQYAAYEEKKKNMGKPKKKSSVQFYTRPGKPKTE